ncbi:MAG: hypothetical protein VYC39_09145 [Myxococcota bacterium]|nr:hypothetical protein [Myxococcota bacterium]
MRWLALISAFLFSVACDDTELYVAPEPIDSGVFADASSPDPDAGLVDAGFIMDASQPPEKAQEPIYIHTGDTLYSYEIENNRAVEIGQFRDRDGPLEGIVDIAIDLDGKMFGGTRDKKIYLINASTGYCEYRFSFDDILHGLTFLSDGSLVVAGERVSIINPTTGELQLEIAAAQEYETSGDIVGLPDGMLYWTVRNNNNNQAGDGVVRISPISGRIDWIGEASVQQIYGLGYAEDRLYGFSDDGIVVTIDPQSGRVLNQQMLSGRWWGATTNPVFW